MEITQAYLFNYLQTTSDQRLCRLGTPEKWHRGSFTPSATLLFIQWQPKRLSPPWCHVGIQSVSAFADWLELPCQVLANDGRGKYDADWMMDWKTLTNSGVQRGNESSACGHRRHRQKTCTSFWQAQIREPEPAVTLLGKPLPPAALQQELTEPDLQAFFVFWLTACQVPALHCHYCIYIIFSPNGGHLTEAAIKKSKKNLIARKNWSQGLFLFERSQGGGA